MLVHVGFAIQKVDEEEAMQTLTLLRQLEQDIEGEFATTQPGDDERGYP